MVGGCDGLGRLEGQGLGLIFGSAGSFESLSKLPFTSFSQ